MDNAQYQAAEATALTTAHQNETALSLIADLELSESQKKAVENIGKINLLAGRIQATKLVATFVDSLTVSQLRDLKVSTKDAGLTWHQACQTVGISTKTADQYLRLGTALGDDWVADVRHLGVSIRTLETARHLPEEARKLLTSGEVVDLEQVGKEELTQVIRDLARDHAEAQAASAENLAKETKAKEKAEAKTEELEADLKKTEADLEALKQGLPADEAMAIRAIQKGEAKMLIRLVVIKESDLSSRSPVFLARVSSSLEFIQAACRGVQGIIQAAVEGMDPDEDMLMAEAQELNRDLADADNRTPYAGL